MTVGYAGDGEAEGKESLGLQTVELGKGTTRYAGDGKAGKGIVGFAGDGEAGGKELPDLPEIINQRERER